jgi:ubiquinone/menaquinone biosynthesis C-methylase UbiE
MTQELPLADRLELFDRFYGRVHQRMVSALDIGPHFKALDAGCGTGGFTALLAKAAFEGAVVALDPALEHLARTRDVAEQAGASRRVVCCTGDIENLQFLGGEFDLVWCSRVIHHFLPHPSPSLNELYRVLKPGGRVALRESGRRRMRFSLSELEITGEFLDRLQDGRDRWFQSKYRSRVPGDAHWRRILLEAGFKKTEVMKFSFAPPSPDDQRSYLHKAWLRNFLLIDRSPEYGRVLDPSDAERLDRILKDENGVFFERDLGIEEESVIYIGYK